MFKKSLPIAEWNRNHPYGRLFFFNLIKETKRKRNIFRFSEAQENNKKENKDS